MKTWNRRPEIPEGELGSHQGQFARTCVAATFLSNICMPMHCCHTREKHAAMMLKPASLARTLRSGVHLFKAPDRVYIVVILISFGFAVIKR